jgi:Protein of unknown function (DUF3303)
MLHISEYRFRPGLTKDDTARLMELFAKRGPEEGTIAHYVRADGTGGIVIAEQSDTQKVYAGVLAYSEYLDFTVTPALSIEDAIGPITDYLS